MIKSVNLKMTGKTCSLLHYVKRKGVVRHTLVATIKGGYKIVQAGLEIVKSEYKGNISTYALFEAYTDYGEKMCEEQIKQSGLESEFMALKSVMTKAGIEFNPTLSGHFKIGKMLSCKFVRSVEELRLMN